MPSRPHIASISPVLVVLLLGGCRIERTPDEYFDHGATAEEARVAAEAEVRDRLLAFVAAAGRGDALQGLLALNPAEEAQVVAPAGFELGGGGSVRAALGQLVSTPVALRVEEVDVDVEAGRGGAAWFRMVVEGPGTTPEPSLYQATGTFVNNAGLWTLVQAHVSGPLTSDSTEVSPPSPPDSGAIAGEAE